MLICAVGSKRRIFSAPECVLAVQGCSGSPKVDDFGTNRKRVYDFLLVVYCDYGPNLHVSLPSSILLPSRPPAAKHFDAIHASKQPDKIHIDACTDTSDYRPHIAAWQQKVGVHAHLDPTAGKWGGRIPRGSSSRAQQHMQSLCVTAVLAARLVFSSSRYNDHITPLFHQLH